MQCSSKYNHQQCCSIKTDTVHLSLRYKHTQCPELDARVKNGFAFTAGLHLNEATALEAVLKGAASKHVLYLEICFREAHAGDG